MPSCKDLVQAVLAKQITNEADVKGDLVKVFQDSCVDYGLVLIFRDGTWAYYRVYEEDWSERAAAVFSCEPPDLYLLHSAGLIPPATYHTWEDQRAEEKKEASEKEDYERFLELKKRFEGEDKEDE